MLTDVVLKNAETALVKLGEKAPAQAAELVKKLTPAEQLAAHSCQLEGDKMRLISLLDHVSTREHLEADLAGYLKTGGDGDPADDPTDLDEPTV